jgi:hypothetical protein
MIGDLWKLYKEEPLHLCSSPSQVKDDDIGKACSTHWEDDVCIKEFISVFCILLHVLC